MKVLISSLQVSEQGSKGHLNPALEIGLELKRRGHEVAILPLPCSFNLKDKAQIESCGITIFEPPVLPAGVILSATELTQLAKHENTRWKAYHSFLVKPLDYQFDGLLTIFKNFAPDVIVYDLLVYAAPLVARLLNIPDIGFCAGLKLIAPAALTQPYQLLHQQLKPDIDSFLKKQRLSATFHHLELLSQSYQLVFAPQNLFLTVDAPPYTVLAGPLPCSIERVHNGMHLSTDQRALVLCFGSAIDPANYPAIMQHIIKAASILKQPLIICSQKGSKLKTPHVSFTDYLPLPSFYQQTAVFIHHGGANTFSECMMFGVPQIIIPLMNDQPIQAELLIQSKAGISIHPHDITTEGVVHALNLLLNKDQDVHKNINLMKKLFEKATGAITACNLIQHLIHSPHSLT